MSGHTSKICVCYQMCPQIVWLRKCTWVAIVWLFFHCVFHQMHPQIMMFEAGCIEIFSKNMAFDKLFPVCSISWLFNSAVLITLEPQLIQVGSNLMFLHWWPYACAGLKLEWKPSHIFHIKSNFDNCLYLLSWESHNVPTKARKLS